ncbi:DNA polymerase Y family protein [Leucobacter sp. HY1908]
MTVSPPSQCAERVIAVWVPDWPVHALRRSLAATATATPLALVARHRIVACCSDAREAGVRTGMRERDAQALCPTLELHAHDPARDARSFAPVVSALEEVVTGVEARRPGLAALRARGPARYYGGEEAAAHTVIHRLEALEVTGTCVGVADGLFAAEQAARAPRGDASHAVTVIPAGAARAFLAPLPVARAAPGPLATTLQGLGIHTLGALAALPEDAVRQRFGVDGIAAHRHALALGPQHGSDVRARTPPRELATEAEFEPPLNAGAQLTEAASGTVARFFASLHEAGLVCTGLRIELTDDTGARHERVWSHPSRFTEEDLLDRVRWQAEGGTPGLTAGAAPGEERGGAGIVHLKITPTHTGRAQLSELWGAESDERVRHHLRGIQLAHGQGSVVTASLGGGRLTARRQQFTPWGHASRASPSDTARGTAGLPWPGAGPAPTLVFPTPLPVTLVGATGVPVRLNEEDLLTTDPALFSVLAPPMNAPVIAWSAPWPLRERWWVDTPPRARLQVVTASGSAWLLVHEADRWFAEGRYD